MDFRTRHDNQIFGVRATGLVVQDEKLYLVKSPEGKYYTLGGAIQLGETTEEAVLREMQEEIGIEVELGPLAFIDENQFTLQEKSYHQIEFLYIVTRCLIQLPIWKKGILFASVNGLLLRT